MSYELMSDEDKILQAFDFVARGVPIPNVIAQFLRDEGLYDAIINPVEVIDHGDNSRTDARYLGSFSGEAGQDVQREGSNLEAG